MDNKKYIISDTLQPLIDWENIMQMERYAGGHDDQMKGLFKDATVIAHWNEGDYQGMVATCVQIPDGHFVIYNDYYGSCSGCDSWENASDQEVKAMCINLANGAYIFQSLADVKEFLISVINDDKVSFDWNECAKSLLNEITKYTNEYETDEIKIGDFIHVSGLGASTAYGTGLSSEEVELVNGIYGRVIGLRKDIYYYVEQYPTIGIPLAFISKI